MFDGQEGRFRSIKLRPKQLGCAVCGEAPTVTELQDYETFCGSAATDKVRIKCRRAVSCVNVEHTVVVQFFLALWHGLDYSSKHIAV